MDDLNIGPARQKFGAVVFSRSVTSIIPLSADAIALKAVIASINQPKSNTATHLGIKAMTRLFEDGGRPGVRKLGIVITDGQSNSKFATIAAAVVAKEAGITMIAVGVGSNLNMEELNAIADSPANVSHLANFDALSSEFKDIVKTMCIGKQRIINVYFNVSLNSGLYSKYVCPMKGEISLVCGTDRSFRILGKDLHYNFNVLINVR